MPISILLALLLQHRALLRPVKINTTRIWYFLLFVHMHSFSLYISEACVFCYQEWSTLTASFFFFVNKHLHPWTRLLAGNYIKSQHFLIAAEKFWYWCESDNIAAIRCRKSVPRSLWAGTATLKHSFSLQLKIVYSCCLWAFYLATFLSD